MKYFIVCGFFSIPCKCAANRLTGRSTQGECVYNTLLKLVKRDENQFPERNHFWDAGFRNIQIKARSQFMMCRQTPCPCNHIIFSSNVSKILPFGWMTSFPAIFFSFFFQHRYPQFFYIESRSAFAIQTRKISAASLSVLPKEKTPSGWPCMAKIRSCFRLVFFNK